MVPIRCPAAGWRGGPTLFVLMAKANCYRRRGSREPAADTYRAALHLNPFCVEAVGGLLEVTPTQLEQSAAAVKRLYSRSRPGPGGVEPVRGLIAGRTAIAVK